MAVVIATEDGAVVPFPTNVFDALEICGGLSVRHREVELVANAIATEDGNHPSLLSWEERTAYDNRAKAAIAALGIEIDNGKGL